MFDGPRPPRDEGRRYLIVGPKPGQWYKCIPLTNILCSRFTHWMDRTVLCTEKPDCPFCIQHIRRTWRGWLPCVELSTWSLFIQDLPIGPGRIVEQLIEQQRDLRKLLLVIGRKAGKKCGKVELTVEHGFKPPKPVPHPFDPWPTVAKMFGLQATARPFRLTDGKPSVN